MKTATILLLLMALPFMSHAKKLTATVVDIIDGDTIIIKTATEQKTVHLGGYEAPEPGQPFFQEAKNELEKIIAGKPVTVKDLFPKKNIVSITPANHKSIPIIMIGKGYGWAAEPTSRVETEMEMQAKMKRVGLWSVDNPETPWAYRARMQRSPEIGIKIGRDKDPSKVLKNLYGDSVSDIPRDPDGTAVGEGGGVAFSNQSVPFSYDGSSSYYESRLKANDNNIKQNCQDKWGSDYSMVKYCIQKQTTAKHSLQRRSNKDLDILQFCEERWGEDWSMIETCYGNQKSAKRQVERY